MKVKIEGLEKVFKRLESAKLSQTAVNRLVLQTAALMETRVKGNASGRPGPNAPTGDYRRSIVTESANVDGVVRAVVGTTKPQAARLENGFEGTDSLGRVYDAPAYPHFGPAIEATKTDFIALVVSGIAEVVADEAA